MTGPAPISEIYAQMIREEAQAAAVVRARVPEFVIYAESCVEMLMLAVTTYRQTMLMFQGFHVHAKKAAALALLSGLHQHRVQLNANLRQLIESTSHFAYFAHHTEVPQGWNKAGATPNEIFLANEKLTKGVYKWMTATYPEFSHDLQHYKSQLNRFTAHATVLTTGVMLDFEAGEFLDQFSDAWSDVDCRIGLFTVGQIAMLSTVMLLHLRSKVDHFETSANLEEKIQGAMKTGSRLRLELLERLG